MEKNSGRRSSSSRLALEPRDYGSQSIELPSVRPGVSLKEGVQPFGVDPRIRNAIEAVLEHDLFIEGLESYHIDLTQAISYIRERHNISNKPGIFLSGNGSNGIINRLPELLPPPPAVSQVFVIGPSFQNILNAVDRYRKDKTQITKFMRGTAIDAYPLTTTLNDSLDFAIHRRVGNQSERSLKRPTMWYFCNPGTPKGDCASPEQVEEFVRYAANLKHDVVVDEAFGDVLPDDESAIRLTDKYPNVAVLRSASKIIGLPGLRLGWMVASPSLAEKYERLTGPNEIPVQTGLIANAILNPDLLKANTQRVIEKTVAVKVPLVSALENAGFYVFPTDPRVPIMLVDGGRTNFMRRLNLLDVDVVGGSGYAMTFTDIPSGYGTSREGISDRYVRITVPSERDQIYTIVERFKEARDT